MGKGKTHRTLGTRRIHRTSNSQPPQPDQATGAVRTPAPPSQTVSSADQERIHKKAAKKQTEFENMFWGEDGMRHIPSELMTLRRKVEGFKMSSTEDDGGSLGLTVNKTSEDFQQMTKKIEGWVSIEGMSDQDSQIANASKRLVESHAEDVQTMQARYQTIAHANMVIEEHGANLTSGKQFLEEYRLQAEQYKRDGKSYPETQLIDQAKENISKYKDEDKQIQKVRTDASQDIADKWKKDDPLRKEVENKVKESEKLHSEAKEYRSGNDQFQKVAGDLEGTVRKLSALYTQVILTEPEKVRCGVRKLEEAQEIKRDLEKRAPEIAALYKKTGRKKLKVKMSEENVKVLAKFSEDLRQLQEMSDTSNGNLNQQMLIFMHRRKREAEDKYQGKISLMLSDKVTDAKQTIMYKMDEYISSDTKWKFHKDSPFMTEMKAEEETYADEKESLQKIYEDEKKPDAASGESKLSAKDRSAIEKSLQIEDLDLKRKEYEKKKQRITGVLEVVDSFDKDGNQAHPVMQIIRRVKRIEQAGGELSAQEQPQGHGMRDAVLDHLSLEGGLTAAISKTLRQKDEEIVGTVIDHSMELQSAAASSVLDFGGGAKAFNGSGEAKAFQGEKSLLETPKGLEETTCALSIVSAVSGAVQRIRSIVSFFKGMKGKSSAQKWEEGMSLVDELSGTVSDLIDAGNGIAEFFKADFLPDNPIMSTVRAVIKIAADIGKLFRAVRASGVMEEKEKLLWAQMPETTKNRNADELSEGKRYRLRTRILPSRIREEEQRAKSYAEQKLLQDKIYRAQLTEELGSESQADQRIQEENTAIEAVEYRKSARASDVVNATVISRRYQAEKEKREAKAKSPAEYEKAKARVKEFKTLERHGEFQIAAEARNRQYNVERSQIEDIIKEGIQVTASWLKTSAMPATAIAGIAMEIGMSAYNVVRNVASKSVQAHRDKAGSFYSTANKQYRRSKMAELMYDRMRVTASQLNSRGRVEEGLKDWQMKVLGDNLKNLKTDFLGVGMKTKNLLEAVSRDDMISSMAEAFGTAGQA